MTPTRAPVVLRIPEGELVLDVLAHRGDHVPLVLDEHLALLEDLRGRPAELELDRALDAEPRLTLEVSGLHVGQVEGRAAEVVLSGGRLGVPQVLTTDVVVGHLHLQLVGEERLEVAVELKVLVPHRVKSAAQVRGAVQHVVAQVQLGVPGRVGVDMVLQAPLHRVAGPVA